MLVHVVATNEPIIPEDGDDQALRDAICAMTRVADNAATLALSDGTNIELPASVVTAIRQTLDILSHSDAVAITPVNRQLTPYQAGVMLNVREAYVQELLDNGDLPFTTRGTVRFIALEDVLAHKRVKDAQTREGLRELTRLSQEMGFYQPHELDPGTI